MPRAGRPRPGARVERTTVSVTCVADGRAHQVPDAALAAPDADRRGVYRALCGHVVVAASLVEPDGAPCPYCTGG